MYFKILNTSIFKNISYIKPKYSASIYNTISNTFVSNTFKYFKHEIHLRQRMAELLCFLRNSALSMEIHVEQHLSVASVL